MPISMQRGTLVGPRAFTPRHRLSLAHSLAFGAKSVDEQVKAKFRFAAPAVLALEQSP